MAKFCLGCTTMFNDEVWFHDELELCSKCYNIHIHSNVKKWDIKQKKWVSKTKEGRMDKWLKVP